MKALDADSIVWAAQLACLLEVSADKPGNVTWGKAFRDMRFIDLMVSAAAIGPALRDAAGRPVGETILRAIQDTQQFVGTNTNLGMVLLLAPLARAAGRGHPRGLRAGLEEVLQGLTVEDARLAFQAIRLASPGGLGDSAAHDVHDIELRGTLLEAMAVARERDAVAREYVTGFEITFGIGYPALARFWRDGRAFSDAVVQTALTILAQVPDTLIARKEGLDTATQVSRSVGHVLRAGGAFSESGREALQALDHAMRDEHHRLNPGTTADLTTASIFVFLTAGGGLEHVRGLVRRW
jgi:triphosphoribosyl-dephospho-CoA synthase